KGKRPMPNLLAENLLRSGHAAPAATAGLSKTARLTEARERMVLLMVNEAALALGEGLAADAGAIDLAMVLGTGWAPHRGGPLRYLADRGSDEVVQALRTLAQRHGPRFAPCASLSGEPGA